MRKTIVGKWDFNKWSITDSVCSISEWQCNTANGESHIDLYLNHWTIHFKYTMNNSEFLLDSKCSSPSIYILAILRNMWFESRIVSQSWTPYQYQVYTSCLSFNTAAITNMSIIGLQYKINCIHPTKPWHVYN